MDAKTRNELDSIKNELKTIINDIDNVSDDLRNNYIGIGSQGCANLLDNINENYRKAKRKLENI